MLEFFHKMDYYPLGSQMQKLLLLIGVLFILLGLLLPWLIRLGIGHWPGDIIIKKENFTFYFPLTTGIVLSIIISLIFWFLNK